MRSIETIVLFLKFIGTAFPVYLLSWMQDVFVRKYIWSRRGATK